MWPLKGESTTSVGAGSQGEEQSYMHMTHDTQHDTWHIMHMTHNNSASTFVI